MTAPAGGLAAEREDEDRARPSIGVFWTAAFVGAALVVLAAMLGLSAYWLEAERTQTRARLAATAGDLVTGLASRVAVLRGRLDEWRDNGDLQAVLAEGRPLVLRTEEDALRLRIPGARDVHLFRIKDIEPGGDARRLLSYAGLEMVRAVAREARIAALEAHRVRQPEAHLAIAGPVMAPQGAAVLGVIHVELPLSMLPRSDDGPAADLQYRFVQPAAEANAAIGAPDGVPVARSADLREPVPGTRLELRAWLDLPGLFDGARVMVLAAFFLPALVGLGLVLWLPYRAVKKRLSADLDTLARMVTDAAAQRPAPMQLAELTRVRDRIRRPLRQQQADQRVHPPSQSPGARAPAPASPAAATSPAPDRSAEAAVPAAQDSGDPSARAAPAAAAPSAPAQPQVSDEIFRAYDIRGLLDSQLDPAVMAALGRAVGSEARARGSSTVVVGRDQRPSSVALSRALMGGLLETGVEVVDLGIAATPLVYFACGLHGGASGAIVTASHNPPQYNGLKVVLAGVSATAADIAALRERLRQRELAQGQGSYREEDIRDAYVAAVVQDIVIARSLKVAVECGSATASLVAPSLLRALGCEVVELSCTLDPELADRHRVDPAQPRLLEPLADKVRSSDADLGVGFDADGDRLGVVDSGGRFVAGDRVLMLFAADVLSRHPGSDIVYDVKCSHRLGAEILRLGGRPVMWKAGHSYLKEKLRELQAPLGGELSGHIVFAERWNGFDDAFYAAARLLELLAWDPRASQEVFAELPAGVATPELLVPVAPEQVAPIMRAVLALADRLEGVEITTIDGLRAETERGWGLVRASNTQSGLVFRFEADDQASLDEIQDLFRRIMRRAAPQVEVPF